MTNLTRTEFILPEALVTRDPVGARMSSDFLALRRGWSVAQAMFFVRRRNLIASRPYYLYVVDENEILLGVLAQRTLLSAAPDSKVETIMSTPIVSVSIDSDQELAARLLRDNDLLALPVVDAAGRLRGVVTADDVLDIQVEEDTEDMFRMAGVGVKEHAFSPVLESATRRVPWLAFNMAWAFAGAFIISVFEGTLEKAAMVAVFMPMIAGQCGNAGIQTATIVVRSMALGEIGSGDIIRLLRKEWALGMLKGVIFGGVLAVVAWVWQGNAVLGIVAGVAMFLNMLVASTAGVAAPLTLRRFGIDPATIAGVFDTMLTDLMGFLIYLGLATLLISQLT
jgi:magnesium transporter